MKRFRVVVLLWEQKMEFHPRHEGRKLHITSPLPKFWMGVYEITQKNWFDVMGTISSFSGCETCPVESV